MRVLMQSRTDLFDKPGGDTIQLKKTKQELEKLGVTVGVSLDLKPDLNNYDLVHLFNLDRCQETYLQAKNAKKQGKSIALSTIHHRFGEIEDYERKMRYGFRRIVNPIFRTYRSREYLKNFYRALFDAKQRTPFFYQIIIGIRRQQLALLRMADVLLPNAHVEAQELLNEFGAVCTEKYQFDSEQGKVSAEQKATPLSESEWSEGPKIGPSDLQDNGKDKPIVVVPNGVDIHNFFSPDPYLFKDKYDYGDFILCVARIEARKNQLKIIEAVKNIRSATYPDINLVLVGRFNSNHPEYCRRVRKKIGEYPWLYHIERIPYQNMPSAFVSARVHISASLFETTGLVNCEAGLAGCNVVASNKGYSGEYLKNFAWYCDPYVVSSIEAALSSALEAPEGNEDLKQRILDNYSWQATGRRTLEAYKLIL